MRILFLGDVLGRSGREAIIKWTPNLRKTLGVDFVIVNAENAAHGFGLTADICKKFWDCGVDAITSGNHIWDQRDIIPYLETEPRLLRPLNYPAGTPGRGASIIGDAKGHKVLVVNAMGRLYMDPLDDPFTAMDRVFAAYRLGREVSACVVDFHAEATSEKMAMGHHCDGRASLVVGTHTHIPTADTQILPGGTAYQTDAGMCGDYDSVIGMKKDSIVQKFIKKTPTERMTPATGKATICGTLIETDEATGLARSIDQIRLGGRLRQSLPDGVEL